MSRPDRSADALLEALATRIAAAARMAPTAGDSLLAGVARTAATVLRVGAVSIATHDPATDELEFVAAAGPAAGDVVGLRIASGAGIAGYVFTTGQPLAVADVAADPRFDRTVAEATGYVPRSLLATPLIDAVGTIGVLEALDGPAATFSLHDLDVAAAFAQHATDIVRAGSTERAARTLLRNAIEGWRAADDDPSGDEDIDTIVDRAVADLAADDDPTWRLADRLARLRDVDPEMIELAIDWLDAMLHRRTEADRSGHRSLRG
jgi:GAF domain-containing protein